jgi:hypothetical protein
MNHFTLSGLSRQIQQDCPGPESKNYMETQALGLRLGMDECYGQPMNTLFYDELYALRHRSLRIAGIMARNLHQFSDIVPTNALAQHCGNGFVFDRSVKPRYIPATLVGAPLCEGGG